MNVKPPPQGTSLSFCGKSVRICVPAIFVARKPVKTEWPAEWNMTVRWSPFDGSEHSNAAVRLRGRDRKTTFRQTGEKQNFREPRKVASLFGERRSSGMNEFSCLHGNEWYAACDDDVHRDSEHRIVTPTIPIRTLKGCGLTQGKSPEYPLTKLKHKNGDDIFE